MFCVKRFIIILCFITWLYKIMADAELPKHAISAENLQKLREIAWGVGVDYVDPEAGVPLTYVYNYAMMFNFTEYLPKIRNFPVDKGDVYVNSFPKSGTTWMQHIVWYLCTEEFDCEESIDYRFPALEVPWPYPPKPENLDFYAEKAAPRYIKSHCPAEFLPKDVWNAKVIYCYRNPKDTCVSSFHHCRAQLPYCYSGSFDSFANVFLKGKMLFGPWHRHVLSYYNAMKEGKPVLMVAFEDMKNDRMEVIKRVAKFIGKDVSDELAQKVYDATSFKAMKNNESGNYEWIRQLGFWDTNMQPFMRKGIVGDWKNYFTPERKQQFEDYFEEHFKDCDLKFSDNDQY